jgi:hypothetical protein
MNGIRKHDLGLTSLKTACKSLHLNYVKVPVMLFRNTDMKSNTGNYFCIVHYRLCLILFVCFFPFK